MDAEIVPPGVWWTVGECAAHAGYKSTSTVYTAISRGDLFVWRRIGIEMIDSNHFKNWLSSRRTCGVKRGRPRTPRPNKKKEATAS